MKSKQDIEKELRQKFWELQKKQNSQKPFSQEFLTGATYHKGIDSDWNNFVNEVDKGQELTLFISSEDNQNEQKINCHNWTFPFAVEIRGNFNEIAFTSSIFKKGISTTTSFVGRTNFSQSKFTAGASFNGEFVEANFTYAEFTNYVSFVGVNFHSVARFELCTFARCNVSFLQSSFLENAWFNYLDVRGKTNFRFEYCEFRGRFDFSNRHRPEDGSEITRISLDGSEFLKTVLFRQEKSNDFRSLIIGEMSFVGAIFREPLAIRFLNLRNPPNLSKSYLLDTKKLSVMSESWEINDGICEQKILSVDESKFRFLKKYFAEQGNHFKEQEYFAYEMMAHEKLLRARVFSFFEVKKNFRAWFKNLSELVLFFTYKLISNFGMSWARPLF